MTRVTGGNIGEIPYRRRNDERNRKRFNMKNGSLTLNDGIVAGLLRHHAGVRLATLETGPLRPVHRKITRIGIRREARSPSRAFDDGKLSWCFSAPTIRAHTRRRLTSVAALLIDTGDASGHGCGSAGVGSLNISGTGTVRSTGTGTNASGAVTGVTINDDRMVAWNL